MTHEKYTPILCSRYDEYELAVMRRRPVQLVWLDDTGEEVSAQVTPRDLRTRDGEEFLVIEPVQGGNSLSIRLDKILSMT